MSSGIRIVAQQIDKNNGEVISEHIVFNKEVELPVKINDLGFSHAEQIKILEQSQEAILNAQVEKINNKNLTCSLCGKKTKKSGKFKSPFHAVFTDHIISLQRTGCSCGWKSPITIEGTYGHTMHPDLMELQSLHGSDNSFKKVEEYLSKKCKSHRSINSHSRVQKTVMQVGDCLSTLKQSNTWNASNDSSFSQLLILNIDGGHIHSNDPSKRSFEAIIATVYNPESVIQKDKNHKEITKKTMVASAKSDHQVTIKNFVINACAREGMTKDTVLTVLCDGAKNCWSVASTLLDHCKSIQKILDWFHIGKKFKNTQSAIPEELKDEFDLAKWSLWHGDVEKCLSKLNEIKLKLTTGKRKLGTLITYIKNNESYIVNYNERQENGLVFTSNVAESSVNTLINTRQKNDGRMQWSRKGAHNVLQIRSSVQSKTWRDDWDMIQSSIYKEAC